MTIRKTLFSLLLIIGLMLLGQVLFPITTFKFWELLNEKPNLVSPYPSGGSEILGVSVVNRDNFPAFVSDFKRTNPASYQEFSLTVPKIGLKEAKVKVDSNDLDKGPIHLPGSALPGERGNIFISSHSSVLFNNNFSRLTSLKVGDQVKVSALGTEFVYQVIGIKSVDPTDLSVIQPPDSLGRYLSLMTCVPPGLNIKRLVVLAKLI